MKPVRVRFAPSPTGALHIGGVRTALYNFLLARQQGGAMILRIEDTDQTRFVPGAEQYIIDALTWAGITIDEGVGVGGPHAPYRQSERKDLYQQYAQQLLRDGHAYYAFDTEADLEAMRSRLRHDNIQQYGIATRGQMKNSLTLPADEVTRRLAAGEPYVVRIKIPEGEKVIVSDLIRGEVIVNSSQLDDKVLMKSDGMPTYHLANVVDDYLMNISHVIRGEEWLPSAPLHVLLYRFLGWEAFMPQFAHLPLLLKPDGHGKLSKRDADKMGFPIFPLTWKDPVTGEEAVGYREAGYLPEALVNFLAFLGWNPGTEQELFSMEQLIEAFSLERISKAGARFDIQKAQWYNQHYLRAKPLPELSAIAKKELMNAGLLVDDAALPEIVQLLRDRVTFLHEFAGQARFLFEAPARYDEQVIARKWDAHAVKFLMAYADRIQRLSTLSAAEAKALLEDTCNALAVKPGQVLQALRVAITGAGTGPDLMLTIQILGGTEVAARIMRAVEQIKVVA